MIIIYFEPKLHVPGCKDRNEIRRTASHAIDLDNVMFGRAICLQRAESNGPT